MKSCEILREFELTAGQGHPRSWILVSIERAYGILKLTPSTCSDRSRGLLSGDLRYDESPESLVYSGCR